VGIFTPKLFIFSKITINFLPSNIRLGYACYLQTLSLSLKVLYLYANGGSTVVEHTSHPPKVKGLSPVTASGPGNEKMA
jgi:hypothetical protein